MLAGILVPLAVQIQIIGGKLKSYDRGELERIHRQYKNLLKWFTKQSKANELLSEELLDKIREEDIIKLRDILLVDNEEAMVLILILSNID